MKDEAREKMRSDIVTAAMLLAICTVVAALSAAGLGAALSKIESVRGTLGDSGFRLFLFALFAVILAAVWPASLFLWWRFVCKRRW